jgi:ABC-type sugar transport system permease subunit
MRRGRIGTTSAGLERRRQLIGLAFITPWLLGLLIFYAYPLGNSFAMTLNEVFAVARDGRAFLEWTFVGIDNYERALLEDPEFVTELLVFGQESVIMIPIIVVFALLVSYLLTRSFPGQMLFRAVFFLPVIITGGGLILNLLQTQQSAGGALDFLQSEEIITFIEVYFPTDVAAAITGILERFSVILWYSGVQILIFIAGYHSIHPSVYEAAKIDGSTAWETFWKITLPALTPFILLNIIYTIVDQFTLPWNPILALTEEHMTSPDTGIGYSATVGWTYFIFTSLLIGLAFLVMRRSMPAASSGGLK